MSETTDAVTPSPLEVQLAKDHREVREGMKRVEILTEIPYVEGQENKIGFFPKLEGLPGKPVLARYSYGSEAPNMSAMFFDPAKGESKETGEQNTNEFLESQGFTGIRLQVQGKFEGNEMQIEEVDRFTANEKVKIVGNLIFTRDPEVTLFIKPADCPVAVIYCKDKNGNPIVVIDHAGADAINAGISRQGLWALQNIVGVDLSDAVVAIFPGVGKDNFYMSKEWILANGEVKKRENGFPRVNWREFMDSAKTDDPKEERHVDLQGALLMQMLEAGIKPENVQVIQRDVYQDAGDGIAFSRRRSNEHNNERPGGQIVAAQIKQPLPMAA